MLKEQLQKIGLDEKEAKIYLAALELGETNIERLSKKSNIKRTTVYDVIESLKEKGLIGTTIKKKKKYFFASDPREFEHKIEEKKSVLKTIMPELLSITNLIDRKPKIKYYEGIEGIKEIYLDSLRYPSQPVWAWVTDEVFSDYFDEKFIKYYVPQRVKHKIMAYVIAPDTENIRGYKSVDTQSLRLTKIDRNKMFSCEVEIDIYGDNKVAVLSFGEKFGLIIESKKIYNTLKSIFDVHWNSLN